jgi:hypothetical protein
LPVSYSSKQQIMQRMKEIERRVQSLSGVLASPVSEDDYAEKGGEWSFGGLYSYGAI